MATDWSDWIGNTESADDTVTEAPMRLMAATLDRELDGDALPPLWHWLYFLPAALQSKLGPDGHPARGGFVPPIELPRRMRAGGRFLFQRPILKGARIRRVSRVDSVTSKTGRSGELVFLRISHQILAGGEPAIIENEEVVYRQPAGSREGAAPSRRAPTDHDYAREFIADPVLLFRYSALTFNGHRIHYDHPYATGEEGYPGLVVHGPMIATLLLNEFCRQRPDAELSEFEYRAVSPVHANVPFWLCGKSEEGTAQLWARDATGRLAMEATVKFNAGT